MVTGASTADLALILVDARNGVVEQSRRHAVIASLLSVRHLVLCVNKMDLVDFDQLTFDRISEEFREWAGKLDITDLSFIPVSALNGDNVTQHSPNMTWYDGPTLLHHLEHVNVGASLNNVDFRYPVQYVVRPNQDFRGYAGQVASGRVAVGEDVVILPSGLTSKVESIVTATGDLKSANVGDSVMLTLTDEIDISRGDMIVRAGNLPQKSNRLDAVICWMSDEPLKVQGDYWIQHTTRRVKGFVSELNYKIDVDTMHRDEAETLTLNEIGRVQLTTTQPLYYDRYQLNRATGSFILIDPATNNTVAAGMIRSKSRSVDQLMADEVIAQPARPKSSNVVWEQEGISLVRREERNGHKAAVLWFTGLSGSGKSTIAKKLEQALFQMGTHTMFLDGDNLRHGLNGDLGFSSASRQENIRRAGEVAKLAFAHGHVVLSCFISPFTADRRFARQLVPDGRFIEVYVKCDLEVVKRRDTKGLYAKALAGEIDNFTGISSPYEEPTNAEIVVETDLQSPDEIVGHILDELKTRNILSGH
jgi:bifunctional enzyme CysN/CysC